MKLMPFQHSMLSLSLFVLLGCAPIVALGPETTFGQGGLVNFHKDPDPNVALSKDFAAVACECKKVFTAYELPVLGFAISSVGIAVIGAAAGAIGVPMLTAAAPSANKVAIAALGGVSGVTNTLQQTMKSEGLTSEEARNVRNDMRKQWLEATDAYVKAADNITQKTIAIQKATAACISYAAFNPAIKVTKPHKIVMSLRYLLGIEDDCLNQ